LNAVRLSLRFGQDWLTFRLPKEQARLLAGQLTHAAAVAEQGSLEGKKH
jgi:hypothetical protein